MFTLWLMTMQLTRVDQCRFDSFTWRVAWHTHTLMIGWDVIESEACEDSSSNREFCSDGEFASVKLFFSGTLLV